MAALSARHAAADESASAWRQDAATSATAVQNGRASLARSVLLIDSRALFYARRDSRARLDALVRARAVRAVERPRAQFVISRKAAAARFPLFLFFYFFEAS